jgi:hypothetical protein
MPPLPAESLFTIFRYGKVEFVRLWLAGKLQQVPRPGEVALLIDDALLNSRSTFSETSSAYYNQVPGTVNIPAIARALPLNEYLNHPWSDELVDSLGPAVFDMLSDYFGVRSGPDLSDYVVRRASSIIGTTPTAWDMFLNMVNDYAGSMITLLTTTRRLLRINGEAIILPEASVLTH